MTDINTAYCVETSNNNSSVILIAFHNELRVSNLANYDDSHNM
jgi:hypothetical protein